MIDIDELLARLDRARHEPPGSYAMLAWWCEEAAKAIRWLRTDATQHSEQRYRDGYSKGVAETMAGMKGGAKP